MLTEVTQRACERRRDQGHARAHQRSGGVPEIHRGAEPAAGRAVAPAGGRRRTIRTSSRTRCSATCRRSSRARRTASRSRASATSTSVQAYNSTVRSFPTNLTAMMFKMDVKPNFAVADEAAVSAPPTVDFNTSPGTQPPKAPVVPPPPSPARRSSARRADVIRPAARSPRGGADAVRLQRSSR